MAWELPDKGLEIGVNFLSCLGDKWETDANRRLGNLFFFKIRESMQVKGIIKLRWNQ